LPSKMLLPFLLIPSNCLAIAARSRRPATLRALRRPYHGTAQVPTHLRFAWRKRTSDIGHLTSDFSRFSLTTHCSLLSAARRPPPVPRRPLVKQRAHRLLRVREPNCLREQLAHRQHTELVRAPFVRDRDRVRDRDFLDRSVVETGTRRSGEQR